MSINNQQFRWSIRAPMEMKYICDIYNFWVCLGLFSNFWKRKYWIGGKINFGFFIFFYAKNRNYFFTNRIYFAVINICQVYFKYMSDIFQIYARYISNICKIYFKYMPDIFQIYARYISNICKIYFKYMPDIFQIYARYISNIRQIYFGK